MALSSSRSGKHHSCDEPMTTLHHSTDEDEEWELLPGAAEVPSAHMVPRDGKWHFYFHYEISFPRLEDNSHVRHHNTTHSHQPLSSTIPPTNLEQATSLPPQQDSRLLTLPLEIRLRIYDLILRPPHTNEYGVHITQSIDSSPPTVLSILSTCRQALYEAEHIFYTRNLLWVDDHNFFEALGPSRRSALLHIAMPFQFAAQAPAQLAALHELPNLRSLYLIRQTSVKYINTSEWSIMATQVLAQAKKLTGLRDFEIVNPVAGDLSAAEVARKKKLDAIDERLRAAVWT